MTAVSTITTLSLVSLARRRRHQLFQTQNLFHLSHQLDQSLKLGRIMA